MMLISLKSLNPSSFMTKRIIRQQIFQIQCKFSVHQHPTNEYNQLEPYIQQTKRSRSKSKLKSKSIGRIILIRHGQSVWNVTDPLTGTTARFTGWADVDLTDRGRDQAKAAGITLKKKLVDNNGENLSIDCAFCSLLSRSEDTLDFILMELGLIAHSKDKNAIKTKKDKSYSIPLISSWRLNERHYGDLVGFSKEGAERHFGKEDLSNWRNSWSIRPPPMSAKKRAQWLKLPHCQMLTKIKLPSIENANGFNLNRNKYPLLSSFNHGNVNKVYNILEKDLAPSSQTQMPLSESMSDTYNRIMPLWTQAIAPRIREGQNIILVAHANTIRAIIHMIDPDNVDRERMKKIKIPSAKPLVYTFREWRGGREEGMKEVVGRLVRLNSDGREIEQVNRKDLFASSIYRDDNKEDLGGYWIDTDEIDDLSFCTDLGYSMGEQEIA